MIVVKKKRLEKFNLSMALNLLGGAFQEAGVKIRITITYG